MTINTSLIALTPTLSTKKTLLISNINTLGLSHVRDSSDLLEENEEDEGELYKIKSIFHIDNG